MTRLFLVAACVAFPVAAMAQPATGSAGLSGTLSITTGNWNPNQPMQEIPLAIGPYEPLRTFGASATLKPYPITYKGKYLIGVPNSPFRVAVALEFCEKSAVQIALASTRCPAAFVETSRTVRYGENLEVLDEGIPIDRWFDSTKLYVLIWRRASGAAVIGFSSPIRVGPRPE